MKKVIIYFVISLCLFSCAKTNLVDNKINEQIQENQKAAISFYLNKEDALAIIETGLNLFNWKSELVIKEINEDVSIFSPEEDSHGILLHKRNLDINEPGLYNCLLVIKSENDTIETTIRNVPVKQEENTIVNLKLTSKITFDISIDPTFDGDL